MSSGNARPNILFFFTDQQRWDTCGCYGQTLPVTPHLDQMAQEGVLFENAFTCQPVCGPARSSLQTGRYPTEVGCHVNNKMLPIDEDTIARQMRSQDYEVGYIGKWHLASQGEANGPDDFQAKPVPRERRGGYDDFWIASDVLEFTSHSYDGHMFDADGNALEFPDGRYRADAQTDWVLEYLDSRTQEKPFFLFVSYIEPHHQNDHNQYEGPHGSKERWANYTHPEDLVGTEGDWRENYPDYLGCINSLDANLGRVRAKLDELGMSDNTLLVFTSDHGTHFRTRNSEYKRSCHESSIRIPMVIHGPGFTGGETVTDLVSLIDLPPTLLAAAGADEPDYMRGRSLQPLVDGTAVDWPQDVFVQISESQVGRCIRTGRWKYSVQAPGIGEWNDVAASDVYEEAFLYDLHNDPHEKKNLVADPQHAQLREELRTRLLQRMHAVGEAPAEIRPAPPTV